MNNRKKSIVFEDFGRKIVFEAGDDITFTTAEENGTIIVRANISSTIEEASENYMYPPIPNGYYHLEGEWNNGFVIQRTWDGSQLVWIPVGMLQPKATLDTTNFCERFGRKNFLGEKFDYYGYMDPTTELFSAQYESIRKYGGFYITRYKLSYNSHGYPQSIEGIEPISLIETQEEAMKIAQSFENTEQITSHLPFGAEYDCIYSWFIESGIKTVIEVTGIPSYGLRKGYIPNNRRKYEDMRNYINNLHDFALTNSEWTQELYKGEIGVIRGGGYSGCGNCYNYCAAKRITYNHMIDMELPSARAALYIR